MQFRVTRPITVYGRYYGLGEIVTTVDDTPEGSSVSQSLARLYRWEPVGGSETPAQAGKPSGLNKPDLYTLAAERGLEVPANPKNITKKELLELLGES